MVRAFALGAMGRPIDPSCGEPIELFQYYKHDCLMTLWHKNSRANNDCQHRYQYEELNK